MPYHTISSSTAGGLQLQENNRKKKKKRKKNQIIVVNRDDITRYCNYAKTIKVSLRYFLFLFLFHFFFLLGKAKEWNQYVYLGRESGMNMEEENPIIQYL